MTTVFKISDRSLNYSDNKTLSGHVIWLCLAWDTASVVRSPHSACVVGVVAFIVVIVLIVVVLIVVVVVVLLLVVELWLWCGESYFCGNNLDGDIRVGGDGCGSSCIIIISSSNL